MTRGRKQKLKDDGSTLPNDLPPELASKDEAEAYRSLCNALNRVQSARASDFAAVIVAAKRMARLQMLYKKLDKIVDMDQLIDGCIGEPVESTIKEEGKNE